MIEHVEGNVSVIRSRETAYESVGVAESGIESYVARADEECDSGR